MARSSLYPPGSKYPAGQQRLKRVGSINAVVGKLDFGSGKVVSSDGDFALGVLPRNCDAEGVSARFHFGVAREPLASHGALVIRYQGPSDQNMIAAIFQIDDRAEISAGIWTCVGSEWTQNISSPVNADMLQTIDGLPALHASLVEDANAVQLSVNGKVLLSLHCSAYQQMRGDLRGIRLHGANIAISDLKEI